MPLLDRTRQKSGDSQAASEKTTPRPAGSASTAAYDGITEKQPETGDAEAMEMDNSKVSLLRPYTFAVAAIVSIGGFIFGYGK